MIHCPYCGKEIPDGVMECLLKTEGKVSPKKVPWYFSLPSLVTSFLFLGPFMLPLVWMHPTLSRKTKILTTVILIILTVFLSKAILSSVVNIQNYYSSMYRF